jgi:hypothetical protein
LCTLIFPVSFQVYVVFMENYMKPSHWVAVCMNIGGAGAAENWKPVGVLVVGLLNAFLTLLCL